MDRYKLVLLHWSNCGVQTFVTDPSVLDTIAADVEKIVPDYRVKEQMKVPGDVLFQCWFDNLHGKDHIIGPSILQHLCSEGWEPLQVGGHPSTESGVGIWLRLEEQDEEKTMEPDRIHCKTG